MKIRIAENIRNLRKENSLTQEQMAEALGVTVGAVYKWEAGLSVPEIRLIMEIADFFEISVDTLLGYEQQNGSVENRIQRIRKCIAEKDFEEGANELEKALKKYPNNFNVVYAGAILHMLKFSEEKCEESMVKSNELFEKAISLLYQNTEESISEASILNHMAQNYLTIGNTKKGLEILKKNNICNINSSLIGFIYAIELKNPKEAANYLLASICELINKMIYTVSGIAYSYAQNNDKACIDVAVWLIDFFDSLKQNEEDITFLDKFKAILLAQCAVWESFFGCDDEAGKLIISAYDLAQKFDKSPVYTMEGIKLFKGVDKGLVSVDGIGKTAVEAVENFVFEKMADDKIGKRWEELKDGYVKA